MNLKVGDTVLYHKDDKLYEGIIKTIHGEKIEIDDNSIKLIVVAISKNTIADNLIFKKKKGNARKKSGETATPGKRYI